MIPLDKEKTGRLIAQARKEKGLTQQKLAEQLHITGKAVSKWETGVSAPDVGLLIPLSETLGLTVTELLEGRRIQPEEDRTPEQVEDIVKSALAYSEQSPGTEKTRLRKRALLFGLCLLGAGLELAALYLAGVPLTGQTLWGDGAIGRFFGTFGTAELLALIFAGASLLYLPERLPRYYDDNRISGVNLGFFRMNMAGIRFNNRNWPHILRAVRVWCVLFSLATIPLAALTARFFPAFYLSHGWVLFLLLLLGSLFIPIYVLGKKYE